VQVGRHQRARPVLVVAEEHADAAGLAVGRNGEAQRPRGCGGGAEVGDDVLGLGAGPVTEECQRDVEVAGRYDPHVPEVGRLPGHERVDDLVGQAERAEEPDSFFALHASGHGGS
jgi:hypothetical protein